MLRWKLSNAKGVESKNSTVLRFTAFWSFVREFPRGGLNWAAVRPVSRGTHLKQVIARLELAIWRLLAQRRPQLSRQERDNSTQLAISIGVSHARHVRFRLVSIRSLRAFCREASSLPGMSPPLPKYISAGVCPQNAECGRRQLCSLT
jgi:hypothetical protein